MVGGETTGLKVCAGWRGNRVWLHSQRRSPIPPSEPQTAARCLILEHRAQKDEARWLCSRGLLISARRAVVMDPPSRPPRKTLNTSVGDGGRGGGAGFADGQPAGGQQDGG